MAPHVERTSRKTSSSSSSTTMYSLATTKAVKPVNKTVVPKQSPQTIHTLSTDGERTSRKPSTPKSSNAIYSLATTKAVKPANKNVVPKQSRLTNNLQQLRQIQQQQLQQIRAIRRKRTVAFAVNHERVSQPHTGCVITTESDAAAPERDNSSSAQSESMRDTVHTTDIVNNTDIGFGNSTVNRDLSSSRASPAIRESTCTFQQKNTASDDSAEDYQEQQMTSKSMTELQCQERSDTNNETTKIPIDKEPKGSYEDHDTKEKRPQHNNSRSNRLVVDVRCAEAAAAAAISKNNFISTTSSNYNAIPVPVTPIYLSPCVHGANDIIKANARTKRRVGRPSKKFRSLPNQEQQEATSSLPAAELSRKPKIKRVRYDMECVPSVQINKDIWGDVCRRFRKQSAARTVLPNNENNKNVHNLSQSTPNLLLQESVLWIPSSRQEWEECVSEMKAACTSAAFRRWSKGFINEFHNSISNNNFTNNSNSKHATIAANDLSSSPHSNTTMSSFQPPLSQSFIKDRIQIDDPLRGYQIRHAKGGWLQGFLVWTNFTVWTLDFQWNSNHPSSGLQHRDIESEGRFVTDDDGTLSTELQSLPRGAQDPLDGGIVLKQVAEISLLGGLGCGELLLRKAIEDIRKSKNNNYKYVVMQATEGSRKFYEKMGFVRVGAVCRYRWAGYSTKKTGVATAATTGKNPGLNDADPKSTIDPPSTFYGYRHWTYTNESCKSLNAHGGPSIMMCLKLEDEDEKNKQHEQQQTVSELLQPHLVYQKPVIQLFGNVSNPDSENVAPARKSQRRITSSGSLRGIHQQQEQENTSVSHRPFFTGVEGSGGLTATAATARRTSNRSMRGQNKSLADSGYVFYGVEGGRNCPSKRILNTTTNSKNTTKRQRRSSKLKRNVPLEGIGTTKENVNEAVVVPLVVNKSDLGSTSSHEGASPIIVQAKGLASPLATTSFSKSSGEKSPVKVPQPSSPLNGSNSNEIIAICTKKNIENPNITFSLDQDHKKSSAKSRNVPSTSGEIKKCIKNMKSDCPQNRRTTAIISKTKTIDIATAGASPTEAPKKGGAPIEVKNRAERIEDPSLNNPAIDPSLSKVGRKTAVRKMHKSIEENRNKSPSPSLTCKQGDKLPEQRVPVHHYGTRGNHSATIMPRKRSRKPVMLVNTFKLFKQKVSRKASTATDFYNQVVVRRNIQNVHEQGSGQRVIKRRRGNENPTKGRIRWRYNGGLMIDHRYEFCYYFVLHYNESEKTMTIVPMLKDGVFERTTGSKNNSINSSVVDERLLGRPRYQCNILKTDKNWIRDASLEDYAIVPEAATVFDTPLVAQEAWDLGGDSFLGPYV